jgi:hypothetical protein
MFLTGRNWDLPACSIVPQATTLPRFAFTFRYESKFKSSNNNESYIIVLQCYAKLLSDSYYINALKNILGHAAYVSKYYFY